MSLLASRHDGDIEEEVEEEENKLLDFVKTMLSSEDDESKKDAGQLDHDVLVEELIPKKQQRMLRYSRLHYPLHNISETFFFPSPL